MLRSIDHYYGFLRLNYKKLHLSNMMANINFALFDSKDKEVLLEALIKIAMEFRHGFSSTMQHIANICVNLIDFYKIEADSVVDRLGLNDERDIQELKRIFKHVRESIEDYEWLTLQMKDWLKVRGRFSTFTSSDY
jgi:hypothetical protein